MITKTDDGQIMFTFTEDARAEELDELLTNFGERIEYDFVGDDWIELRDLDTDYVIAVLKPGMSITDLEILYL